MYKFILAVLRRLFSFFVRLYFSNDPRKINQTFMGGYTQLLWESEHIGRKIKLHLFDRAEIKYFHNNINEGNICIDVGANIGFYTNLFAHHVGVSGQVIAVEPIKRNCKLIELNLEINNTYAFALVECAAISDIEDLCVEYSVCNDSAYSGVKQQGSNEREIKSALNENGKINERIQIKTLTIDGLVKKHNLIKVDVLKIVVEGFVYKALLGAKELLSNPDMRPSIVMTKVVEQQLNYYGATANDIYTYMESFGYRKKILKRNGELVQLNDISLVENNPNVFFVIEN